MKWKIIEEKYSKKMYGKNIWGIIRILNRIWIMEGRIKEEDIGWSMVHEKSQIEGSFFGSFERK